MDRSCEIYNSKNGRKLIPWDGVYKYKLGPEEIMVFCDGRHHQWNDINGSPWACKCPDYTHLFDVKRLLG